MTNIVLITNGSRPRLLEQTLRTLYENTHQSTFNLTVIEDGCRVVAKMPANCSVVSLAPACNIVGRLRNLGAYWSEKTFGRNETSYGHKKLLYFSDDDVSFRPGWLSFMEGMLYHSGAKVIGGCQHPYHATNSQIGFSSWGRVNVTDAVAGYSMLLEWDDWDKYGPFDQHSRGVCQSEDFALCRKIVGDGGVVGYSQVPQIYHCGVTNSEGKLAIGGELIHHAEGFIYQ